MKLSRYLLLALAEEVNEQIGLRLRTLTWKKESYSERKMSGKKKFLTKFVF